MELSRYQLSESFTVSNHIHLTFIQLLWLLDEEPVTADLLLHRSVSIVLLLDTSRPPVLGQVTTLLLFLLSNAPPPPAARRTRVRNLSIDGALVEYRTVLNLTINGKSLSTVLEERGICRSHFYRKRYIAEAALVDRQSLESSFLQLRKVTLQTLYPAAKDICNRKHRDLTRLYAQGNALKPKTRY